MHRKKTRSQDIFKGEFKIELFLVMYVIDVNAFIVKDKNVEVYQRKHKGPVLSSPPTSSPKLN